MLVFPVLVSLRCTERFLGVILFIDYRNILGDTRTLMGTVSYVGLSVVRMFIILHGGLAATNSTYWPRAVANFMEFSLQDEWRNYVYYFKWLCFPVVVKCYPLLLLANICVALRKNSLSHNGTPCCITFPKIRNCLISCFRLFVSSLYYFRNTRNYVSLVNNFQRRKVFFIE